MKPGMLHVPHTPWSSPFAVWGSCEQPHVLVLSSKGGFWHQLHWGKRKEQNYQGHGLLLLVNVAASLGFESKGVYTPLCSVCSAEVPKLGEKKPVCK